MTTNTVPPEDMNGSGNPVTGMMRIVIPMLTKMWNASIAAIPIVTRYAKWFLAFIAMTSSRHSMMPNSSITATEPTKPNCSPTAVKMKSDDWTGTNW